MNANAKRYDLIDGLRGLAVVNMVLYHFLWDLVYLSNIPIGWYTSQGAFFWQQGICWTFIFIAGFCWQFGKHAVRHGLVAFGCGALISAVTWIALPQGAVTFGILTFLGSAMLLLYPLRPWLQKIPPLAGAVGSALLFALTRPVNRGYLLPGWETPGWMVPKSLDDLLGIYGGRIFFFRLFFLFSVVLSVFDRLFCFRVDQNPAAHAVFSVLADGDFRNHRTACAHRLSFAPADFKCTRHALYNMIL